MDMHAIRRDRLRSLVDERFGGKQARLAEAIERQAGYISRCLAGTKGIGEDFARYIEARIGLPALWMDTPPDGVGSTAPALELRSRGDQVDVPVLEVRASMGHGAALPDHDAVVDGIRLSAPWVRSNLPTLTSPHALRVIGAYGDSMTPTFADGDLLLVDTGVGDIKIDAVYVLRLNDELYVKRLQRRPSGEIVMISDNRVYDPYVIGNGERDRFDVLGRVVWAWVGKRM